MVGGYDNTGGGILPLIFFNFSGVMLFLIVATLMPKYAGLAAGISLNIFGGSPDASPLGTGGKATHGLEQGSLSVVGMDDKTRKKRSQENKLEEDHQKKTQDPKDSPKK